MISILNKSLRLLLHPCKTQGNSEVCSSLTEMHFVASA